MTGNGPAVMWLCWQSPIQSLHLRDHVTQFALSAGGSKPEVTTECEPCLTWSPVCASRAYNADWMRLS